MDVFIQTVKHNSPHKDRASSHLQKPGPDACRSTLGRMRAAVVLDSAYILAALAALLIVIATLGALGFGVGFDVFPIGEDNNWIDMLQRGRGAEVARLFWTIDHRNPLSPWWYIAARPIILGFDAGLLALRYAIAAVLALAAYCMVVTVAGRRARAFALGVAMVSVVWMANRFTEQVIWNFQGALAASVLSVAAYARFVEEGRRSYRLYAVSMVLWFVAFATYSIQCGAVLAIGYLAFRRAHASGVNALHSVLKRAGTAFLDTLPYLALFGLFLLLWQTTMGSFASEASFHFSLTALLQSLREGVWTSDFVLFGQLIVTSPDRLAFIAAATICGVVAYLSLIWRERRAAAGVPGIDVRGLVDVSDRRRLHCGADDCAGERLGHLDAGNALADDLSADDPASAARLRSRLAAGREVRPCASACGAARLRSLLRSARCSPSATIAFRSNIPPMRDLSAIACGAWSPKISPWV